MQCPPINLKMRNAEENSKYNHDVIVSSGCSSLDCFQKLSTQEVAAAVANVTNPMLLDLTVNAIFGTPFGPVEDNITGNRLK